MRKSREFDNVLDECLERLLVRDKTIEQCLNAYPEHAEALRPLLETALAAKRAAAIQPRPEFRDKARSQFYSALREMERKPGRFFFSWRWQPQWATAVTVVLVLLLAGSGTVAAASGSMPDEPLYPVKLATERVQLVLTPSSLGKAELYARLADRRVAEIVRMVDKSKPEQIELTARRLSTYLIKITALASPQEVVGLGGGKMVVPAERSPAAKPSVVRQPSVAEEAPVAREALLAERTPTMEQAPVVREAPAFREAPAVRRVPLPAERAKDIRKIRVEAVRRAKLRVAVTRNAVSHAARLRAALQTAPESAKPALLRAIAESKSGYQRAIESLD